ncbi:sensor histidine kinase [Tsuneonella sp. HG222]
MVAWRSWWWDHRLAWPAHVLDILAFLAAVYFTESTRDDFTSPFLAFFAFLMLSATIRWGWRVTAITGFSAAALYLCAGLAMESLSFEIDIQRFGRRVVYMAVLAIILTWLGHQRQRQSTRRFLERAISSDERRPPMDDALRYAMAETDARSGAIAWEENDEPQIELHTIGLPCRSGRLLPDQIGINYVFPASGRLFDRRRDRILYLDDTGGCVAASRPFDDAVAKHCAIDEGLAIPFTAVTGRGLVILGQIPGACADHVVKSEEIGREIGAGFDRHSTLSLVRENVVTLMRDTVARDLHDTIAQSLAGAALRLEALRTWIANGGDADEEIQSIKAALKSEQAQVRSMINRLRSGEDLAPQMTAARSLGPMLGDLSTYWGVEADLAGRSGEIAIPGSLVHELRHLIREGVANAVRHGGASEVSIELREEEDLLVLTIADNGSGFPPDQGARPRTISERTAQLGGRLDISSSAQGATLQLQLPRGTKR